jgi:hypothetical protein
MNLCLWYNPMIELTWSHYIQIMIGTLGGIMILLMAHFASEKWIVGFLILISPFSLIKTQYGSINMVIVYTLGFSYFLMNRFKEYPLKVPIALIIFAYLASLTQVETYLLKSNVIFLISFFSSFILFYIVYNYIITHNDFEYIIKLLIVVNVLVCFYCFLQLFFENVPVLNSFLRQNRSDRLAGPYIVGLTAEFFAIQSVFLLYIVITRAFVHLNKYLYVIFFLNFSFLIATGNRGGFLVLVGGLFLFFIYFRRTFNLTKMLAYSIVFFIFFIISSMFVLKNTNYNVLFSRLVETQLTEDGIPDTRKRTWPQGWNAFLNKPILGHGPRMGFDTPTNHTGDIAGYPHNLYLYVMVTTGLFGLFAYINLFAFVYLYIKRARKLQNGNIFLSNLPTLFFIMLTIFLIDQLKIEFLRFHVIEYQHYVFILFALFIGTSNILFRSQKEEMHQ